MVRTLVHVAQVRDNCWLFTFSYFIILQVYWGEGIHARLYYFQLAVFRAGGETEPAQHSTKWNPHHYQIQGKSGLMERESQSRKNSLN